MLIWNRPLSAYLSNLTRIHSYVWYCVKIFWLFKQPLSVLTSYLTRSSPSSLVVELRRGPVIHLSNHSADILAVFDVFVRCIYGKIEVGTTVIDIGANVGVFSIYCASRGARCIYAYEPNSEAYECLKRNIDENDFSSVIVPCRLAVTGTDGDIVNFPLGASIYNHIVSEDSTVPYEQVTTISLASIVQHHQIIHLLKLDCEGAEYEILSTTDSEAMKKIEATRLEYHGEPNPIVEILTKHGFDHYYWDDYHKIMWFQRNRNSIS